MHNKSSNKEFAFLKYIDNKTGKYITFFVFSVILTVVIIFVFIKEILMLEDNSNYNTLLILLGFSASLDVCMFFIQSSSVWIPTLINKKNFKIDLNNKIINIKNYPVILWHKPEKQYIKAAHTLGIPISKIDSIRQYKKYFVVTIYDLFEFLLPITKETQKIVDEYNKLFENEIGKNVEITELDNPGSNLIINAKIIDTQNQFDKFFYRRFFIVETENNVIINDKNYGRYFILLNRLVYNNLIGNRSDIHIGILHDEYDPSKPVDLASLEQLFIGNLRFL